MTRALKCFSRSPTPLCSSNSFQTYEFFYQGKYKTFFWRTSLIFLSGNLKAAHKSLVLSTLLQLSFSWCPNVYLHISLCTCFTSITLSNILSNTKGQKFLLFFYSFWKQKGFNLMIFIDCSKDSYLSTLECNIYGLQWSLTLILTENLI